MSLSETRRPVALTEEQRAAIREKARRDRFVDTTATMVAHLHRGAAALPDAQRYRIEQQMIGAADIGALRAVAVQLVRATAPIAESSPPQAGQQPTPPAISAPSLGSSVVRPQAATPIPGIRPLVVGTVGGQDGVPPVPAPAVAVADELVAEHLQLSAELGALVHAAQELAIAVPAVAERELHAAERALQGPRLLGAAAAHLRTARAAIDSLEATVDDAVADAAEREHTLAAVTAALRDMGFAVTGVTTTDDPATTEEASTRVEAETDDGRTAEIALVDDDGRMVVDATFSDAEDAVPDGAPGAEEICAATDDAVSFQQRLGATPGLSLGPVVALSRPTRSNGGLARGGTASSASRRARRTSTTPKHRRRTR